MDTNKPTAVVFLDLEETLIDDWEHQNTLHFNAVRVRDFLKNLSKTHNVKVGLMSWAVWDNRDMLTFRRNMREGLEEALDHKFDEDFLWNMFDWFIEATSNARCAVCSHDRREFFDVFKKLDVLFMMRHHSVLKDCHVFLVDDAVDHNLKMQHKNFKLTVLNVNERGWDLENHE